MSVRLGGSFNIDALVGQGIPSVALLKHCTFADAYWHGISVSASGVIVEDNAVSIHMSMAYTYEGKQSSGE